MLYYHLGLFIPHAIAVRTAQELGNGYSFGNDFYQVWITAREWQRRKVDPYSTEMTREIQIGLNGRPLDAQRRSDPQDERRFPYPAFVDLLFWPAADFPFTSVRVVVSGLLVVLTGASVLLWLRVFAWRLDWKWIVVVLLLTLSSYPALEGLYAGQLGLLVAFLLPASVLALQRKRFLLAGILMALTTMKPQEMGLVIIYFLLWVLPDWRTRNRFCVGFMVTLALLVGTSLAVMPHWIHSWISTVMAYRGYNPAPLVKTVLTSPLGPRLAGPAALFVTGAFLIVAGFVAWRHRDAGVESSEFWLTMGLLLCITTIVILPGQAVYDHVILLPAILLLIRSRDALSKAGLVPRVLLWIGAVVLFWPWVAAFGVSVVRVFSATAFDSGVLFLPIRTAASLPFAVLALLAGLWRVTPRTSAAA